MKLNHPLNRLYFPGLLILFYIALITIGCNQRVQKNANNDPIQADTTRYWNYKGQPVLLLGGFNHGHNPFVDGSTLDSVYLDSMEAIIDQIQEMVDIGGNTLRCVLDPGSAAAVGITAYTRTANGLYELNQPTGPYWDRLSTFIAEAEKREVIVELEIWDRFDWYGTNWVHSPFNPDNNVNYTGEASGMMSDYERGMIYINHPMSKSVPGHPAYDTASVDRKVQYDLVRHFQEIYVRKLLSCTFPHRNVLYNMNNETSEPTGWGEYWIKFIKTEAEKAKVNIVCTDMADGAYQVPDSKEVAYQLAHPELYDYLDVSQVNSRHRDEVHWDKIKWVADRAEESGLLLHMTKVYGSDDRLPGPWDSFKPGDTDNAIEEWWRNLIAGVAGVRFHRPDAGIGLSDKGKACIKATRKIESKVKFWDVNPRLDLLTGRAPDEAYLAANPGKAYILYFTHLGQGSVELNLEPYNDSKFEVFWVNIDTGDWGPEAMINGGNIQTIHRPDASAHWVAAICKIK